LLLYNDLFLPIYIAYVLKTVRNYFLRYQVISYFCNNIAKYLTGLRTYKVLLGAFLLALYAFIATPVQFWHHHQVAHAASQTHNSQHDILLQDDGSLPDANCPVCSHKYSSYSEIPIIAFEPCHHVAAAQYGGYQLLVVTAFSFSLPNKGPPAI